MKNRLEMTYNEAFAAHRRGELTDSELDQYVYDWTWSAPRYGGNPGAEHDSYYNTYGSEAYWEKIEATRAALGLPRYKD